MAEENSSLDWSVDELLHDVEEFSANLWTDVLEPVDHGATSGRAECGALFQGVPELGEVHKEVEGQPGDSAPPLETTDGKAAAADSASNTASGSQGESKGSQESDAGLERGRRSKPQRKKQRQMMAPPPPTSPKRSHGTFALSSSQMCRWAKSIVAEASGKIPAEAALSQEGPMLADFLSIGAHSWPLGQQPERGWGARLAPGASTQEGTGGAAAWDGRNGAAANPTDRSLAILRAWSLGSRPSRTAFPSLPEVPASIAQAMAPLLSTTPRPPIQRSASQPAASPALPSYSELLCSFPPSEMNLLEDRTPFTAVDRPPLPAQASHLPVCRSASPTLSGVNFSPSDDPGICLLDPSGHHLTAALSLLAGRSQSGAVARASQQGGKAGWGGLARPREVENDLLSRLQPPPAPSTNLVRTWSAPEHSPKRMCLQRIASAPSPGTRVGGAPLASRLSGAWDAVCGQLAVPHLIDSQLSMRASEGLAQAGRGGEEARGSQGVAGWPQSESHLSPRTPVSVTTFGDLITQPLGAILLPCASMPIGSSMGQVARGGDLEGIAEESRGSECSFTRATVHLPSVPVRNHNLAQNGTFTHLNPSSLTDSPSSKQQDPVQQYFSLLQYT